MTYGQSVSHETTNIRDLKTDNFGDLLTKSCAYSDLLAMSDQGEVGGAITRAKLLLESFLKTNQNILCFCLFLDILTKTNQNESNRLTFQN